MVKKLETKTIIKILAAVFALYLCIHYWPNISWLIASVFSAASPLLAGCCIAYTLNILMSFYERHFFPNSAKKFVIKARRPSSLLLAIVTLLAVIALIAALIVPQLISCVKLLVTEVPGAISFLLKKLEEAGILSDDVFNQLTAVDWQSKIGQIANTLLSGISNVMDIIVSTVSTVISGITTAFLAIIFSIYLLVGKDKLGRQCRLLMKRYIPQKGCAKIEHLLTELDDCFHRFIVGQCTEAVILGSLCALGMIVLRLPYAPMIGAVIAFTALIPIVGAFIGGAVGAFLILMESPVQALIFVIFLIILQQVEGNVIYPKVVGSSIGLPGVWVLAAVTIGGGVLGILGMLLAVPCAACIYRLLRENVKRPPADKAGAKSEPQA